MPQHSNSTPPPTPPATDLHPLPGLPPILKHNFQQGTATDPLPYPLRLKLEATLNNPLEPALTILTEMIKNNAVGIVFRTLFRQRPKGKSIPPDLLSHPLSS